MMTDTLGQWNVNSVNQADALELMRALPDASVDAIITDLPYGTTACSWDEIIPFEPMWAGVKRVLKPRGAFVTTASQPFTSKLVMSNLAWFKYEWVWEKDNGSNFLQLDFQPFKVHENILVFSKMAHNYIPQMTEGKPYQLSRSMVYREFLGEYEKGSITINKGDRYPRSVYKLNSERGYHPTQKPVALYEYLIKTYTLPDQLVLDFCCGSGTTLVAAQRLGRRFLGCDLSAEYVEMARKRLAQPFTPSLFADEPLAVREDDQQLGLFGT